MRIHRAKCPYCRTYLKKLALLLAGLFLYCWGLTPVYAQDIVISEYSDDYLELLVISDNLDLRGYHIRENNQNQNSWTNDKQFLGVSLWNNLRAGTIILLNHNSSAIIDTSKGDGYIELGFENTYFFSSSASFSIQNQGEIIQIRTPSPALTHVHAFGHANSGTGPDWDTLPSPKLLYNGPSAMKNVWAKGGSLSDYDGTNAGRDNETPGLSNDVVPYIINRDFWRSLRQPTWASPSLTSTSTYNTVTLQWNAATDPYPVDQAIGYIILRNISNSFTDPVDGVTYVAGSTLGSATVIANVAGSQTVSYTDSTAPCNTYYYKIYAYRYGADSLGSTAFERGRAYNESDYASAVANTPLKADAGADQTICKGDTVTVGGSPTASGGNSAYTYSWVSIPAGFTSSASNPSFNPVDTTSFIVYITDAAWCIGADTVLVNVNPLPAAYTGPGEEICEGESITIGGAAVAGNTYSWSSNPSGFSSTSSNPTVNPMLTTIYTLTETVTATGCRYSQSVTVTVNPNPATTNIKAE